MICCFFSDGNVMYEDASVYPEQATQPLWKQYPSTQLHVPDAEPVVRVHGTTTSSEIFTQSLAQTDKQECIDKHQNNNPNTNQSNGHNSTKHDTIDSNIQAQLHNMEASQCVEITPTTAEVNQYDDSHLCELNVYLTW